MVTLQQFFASWSNLLSSHSFVTMAYDDLQCDCTARSLHGHRYENQSSLGWFLETLSSHDLASLKQNSLWSLMSKKISKWPAHILLWPNYCTKRTLCACNKRHTYLNLRLCQRARVRSHASNEKAWSHESIAWENCVILTRYFNNKHPAINQIGSCRERILFSHAMHANSRQQWNHL